MKKTSIITLIFVLCVLNAMASELRVTQLGTGWLVPDEYVDIFTNPAMINGISGNILTGSISSNIWNGLDNYLEGLSNRFKWDITPKAAYLGRFEALNAGIICKAANYYDVNNGYFGEHELKGSIKAVFGTIINDNIMIGFSPSAGISYSRYDRPQYVYIGDAAVGVGISSGNLYLGFTFYGGTDFSGHNNYRAGGNIQGEIGLSGKNRIRFFNELFGDSNEKGLVLLDNLANPFEGVFFGDQDAYNNTGISLIGEISGVDFVVSVNNGWNIYSYSCQGLVNGIDASRDMRVLRADTASLRIGFETKFLADWFLLRFSYTPLSYNYSYAYLLLEDIPLAYKNTSENKDSRLNFLPASGLSFGFGFNLADNMILDFGFNYGYLISFNNYESNYSEGFYSDHNSSDIDSNLYAEYTLKW